MTALYVPGVEETDIKKIIRSAQLVASATSTNTTNIATNTASIVTNTSAITALQAGPLVAGAVAAQSDQETSTSTTLAVTPGRQQFHPSAAKAWVKFTGSGSNGAQTITASYNVSGVSRSATGVYTVSFTTAFSSANYACAASQIVGASNGFVQVQNGGMAAGSVQVGFITVSAGAFAAFDPGSGMVVCYGDQ